jgi:DNA-binding response OmpR family regulator
MNQSPDSKKILIVDDDPSIVLSLEFLMVKSGYQVFIARNGTEAIELIKAEEPNLVVLDIMMPDVDGYDVCRFIRSREEWQYIKVIFLSAKSKQEDVQKGLSLGADQYVTKPFSTREFMKTVGTMMQTA